MTARDLAATDRLFKYRAVVGTRKHGGKVKAIYGTVWIFECRCGFASSGGDYITTRRAILAHNERCPA